MSLEWMGASVGIMAGVVGLILLAYDRLRGSGKHDADMHGKVNGLLLRADSLDRDHGVVEVQLALLDKRVGEVLYELKGIDGQNGIKGNTRALAEEIRVMKLRLAGYDVVTALFKAERDQYAGPEKRHFTRRALDAKLAELGNTED